MRNQPFRASTTTNPEETAPFRQSMHSGCALAGVLDEVPNSVPRQLNIRQPMRPESGFVGGLDSDSARHPEQDVVVGATSLREFKNPLVAHSMPSARESARKRVNKPPDLLWPPALLPTVRERKEQAIDPVTASRENRSSCFGPCDDDTSHPPQSTLVVQILQCLSRREVIRRQRCYLFDKPRTHGHGECYMPL
jgi:hypothetical protein